MAIRAYPIEMIVYGDSSFDPSHDEGIMRWIDSTPEIDDRRNDSGTGVIYIPRECIKALAENDELQEKHKLTPEEIEKIKAMQHDVPRVKNIDYDCF